MQICSTTIYTNEFDWKGCNPRHETKSIGGIIKMYPLVLLVS